MSTIETVPECRFFLAVFALLRAGGAADLPNGPEALGAGLLRVADSCEAAGLLISLASREEGAVGRNALFLAKQEYLAAEIARRIVINLPSIAGAREYFQGLPLSPKARKALEGAVDKNKFLVAMLVRAAKPAEASAGGDSAAAS